MQYTYRLNELEDMIRHWIKTPPNSYLGQDYGFNLQTILLKPLTENVADYIISQLKKDIPPLQNMNSSQLAIYKEVLGNDTVKHYIVLNGEIEIEL